MPQWLEIVIAIITCLSPIVIAWFGVQASKNEKQTKRYIEAQEELKKANETLENNEKKEINARLNKIDQSIQNLEDRFSKFEKSMTKLPEIDKRIDNLVEMSNINFEFCTSLSTVITAIGNALDSSDAIESGSLKKDLYEHQQREFKLVNKVHKIVY